MEVLTPAGRTAGSSVLGFVGRGGGRTAGLLRQGAFVQRKGGGVY